VTAVTVVTAVTAVTVMRKIAQPIKIKYFFLLFSEHFWKEQFDKFDNLYNFLRAAFCDSLGVFWWRGCMIFLVERLGNFF
jgi:hypothetical protein